MTDTAATAPEPTEAEIAAAMQVMSRKAAADSARLEAAKAPLREMVAAAGFAPLLEQATALRATLAEGTPFYAHLNAIVTGMGNLQNDIA